MDGGVYKKYTTPVIVSHERSEWDTLPSGVFLVHPDSHLCVVCILFADNQQKFSWKFSFWVCLFQYIKLKVVISTLYIYSFLRVYMYIHVYMKQKNGF